METKKNFLYSKYVEFFKKNFIYLEEYPDFKISNKIFYEKAFLYNKNISYVNEHNFVKHIKYLKISEEEFIKNLIQFLNLNNDKSFNENYIILNIEEVVFNIILSIQLYEFMNLYNNNNIEKELKNCHYSENLLFRHFSNKLDLMKSKFDYYQSIVVKYIN